MSAHISAKHYPIHTISSIMLTDAHCHPTETPELLDFIPKTQCRLIAMSTNLNDQNLVSQISHSFPELVTPAYGLHPWFSCYLSINSNVSKTTHYKSVFQPEPSQTLINELPDPVPLSEFLQTLQTNLESQPKAILGEVGLDKAFKFKFHNELTNLKVNIDHQVTVLNAQLQIASSKSRPVSLHGVQATQLLYDCVKQYSFPKICLHSYGGGYDFYKAGWSKLKFPVYISISTLVNARMNRTKLYPLLQNIDLNLVLSESDFHESSEQQTELVRDSVQLIAEVCNLEFEEVLNVVNTNFRRFVSNQ